MFEDMTIYNRLKVLIAEKELREKRKLTYRVISLETGIPISTLTDYMTQRISRFDGPTLEKLCDYFGAQPGDILIYSQEPPEINKS
jgi:putative transcriptional regulator